MIYVYYSEEKGSYISSSADEMGRYIGMSSDHIRKLIKGGGGVYRRGDMILMRFRKIEKQKQRNWDGNEDNMGRGWQKLIVKIKKKEAEKANRAVSDVEVYNDEQYGEY